MVFTVAVLEETLLNEYQPSSLTTHQCHSRAQAVRGLDRLPIPVQLDP
jgi:hypothetical protein